MMFLVAIAVVIIVLKNGVVRSGTVGTQVIQPSTNFWDVALGWLSTAPTDTTQQGSEEQQKIKKLIEKNPVK